MDFGINHTFAFGTDDEKYSEFIKINKMFYTMDEDTKFGIIMQYRPYFFSCENNSIKELYMNMLFEEFKVSKYKSAYLELMGVLYKYVSEDFQMNILCNARVFYSEIMKTISGTIACINFYKNIHRQLELNEKTFFLDILKNKKNNCDSCLKESMEYLFYNIDREFVVSSDIKEVLIIIPEFLSGSSFLQMPIGVANAVKELTNKNVSCDFLDNRVYSYGIDRLIEISNYYQNVVIVSTPIDQVQNYFLDYRYNVFCITVQKIVESNSQKNIIICGSHGTVRPEIVLKDTDKSAIVLRGEFDYQLSSVIQGLKYSDKKDIPNIVAYEKDKMIYGSNDVEAMHPKKWEEGVVNYEVFDVKDYYGYAYYGNVHVKKMYRAIMQTSRGCPYKCSFCYDFYEKKVRFKNIENIIVELKQLIGMGINDIFFIDQTFTLSRDYTIALCNRIINEKLELEWICETRVDLLDEELVKYMKKAGCKQIWLGIESMSQSVIDENDKGYSLLDLENAVKILNDNNVDYCAFVMMGMMGETEESIKNTVETIISKGIKITRSIMTYTPRFNTFSFEQCTSLKQKKIGFNGLYYMKGNLDNKITYDILTKYTNMLVTYVRKE